MKKLLLLITALFLLASVEGQILRYSNYVAPTPQEAWEILLNDGNTIAWYDASDASTITTSGGTVSEWRDKLGSGIDLAQTTEGYRPAIAGDSITFNGTDEFMAVSLAGFFPGDTIPQPIILYIVMNQVSWTASDVILTSNAYSATRYVAVQQRTSTPGVRFYAGTYSTPNNTTSTVGTTEIWRIKFNGASSSLQIDDHTASVYDVGANSMNSLAITNSGSSTGSGNISFKEIIWRQVDEGSEDESVLYNYLIDKWL